MNDRYKRNNNLPKAGSKKNFTEDQLAELQKCISDPVYFALKYFKIVHVDRGLIPFDLYEYQVEAIRVFETHRNMIMSASRQCGKCVEGSTFINIKNKKTGKVEKISIEDFYKRAKV